MSQRDKDYEKLGLFYLGRHVDLESGQTQQAPFLYDSNDGERQDGIVLVVA